MAFTVRVHEDVLKVLKRLDKPTQKKIKKQLSVLGKDPYANRAGADIKRLVGTKGREDAYRLRIGDHRAVYLIVENEVRVTDLIHRSEGYAMLD